MFRGADHQRGGQASHVSSGYNAPSVRVTPSCKICASIFGPRQLRECRLSACRNDPSSLDDPQVVDVFEDLTRATLCASSVSPPMTRLTSCITE
jgi:hypothetical protein